MADHGVWHAWLVGWLGATVIAIVNGIARRAVREHIGRSVKASERRKPCQLALAPSPPAARCPLPVRQDLRLVATTSLVTAGLLSITAVAGLLFGARGLYNPDPARLPAFLGQDGMTLAVVLPLLLWSVWAARRGSLRGLLLWTATLFYVAYSYAYYALDPEFNVLYLVYIAIVAMSLYGCLYLLLSTNADAVAARFSAHAPIRLTGAFLMVLPTGLGLLWVVMIISHLASGATPNRVNQVVWPMDLIVVFPAMFWGGLWLWRRQPLGYTVATVLLIKGGLLGVTLVVNTWLASTFWGVAADPAVPAYAIGGWSLSAGAFSPPGERERAPRADARSGSRGRARSGCTPDCPPGAAWPAAG